MSEWAVEMIDIVKDFGPVRASDHVNLAIKPGEIHALVGENGAGKSTLMNILYGLYTPDQGEVRIHGKPMHPHSPQKAIQNGLGMVHQHFMLIPPLTVAENVVLGQEPRKGLQIDLNRACAELKDLSGRFGLNIDPTQKVEDLAVGENQRVEILKVLYRGADVLILDEPTAVLTPAEVRSFFEILRRLAGEGKSVVIITHKLDEIKQISDRLTVLRRGATCGTFETATTPIEAIAQAMVGRPVKLQVERPKVTAGDVVLQVEDLEVSHPGRPPALTACSFAIKGGEIFGIAGVEGSGQSELIEALMGLQRPAHGRIVLAGQDMTHYSTRQRLADGVSHIPEDRHDRGLVLDTTLAENLVLGQERDFYPRGWLDKPKLYAHAESCIVNGDIRPPLPDAHARGLSGGNQQKIIIAREFFRSFKLLISAQPTRGVDVGAIEMIHRQLLAARSEGRAVLLISAELSEILALSDRIGVLYKGRLVKTLPNRGVTAEDLGLLMTGASL
jgi:ABC-type uncharacterized transport system ATPase subunit